MTDTITDRRNDDVVVKPWWWTILATALLGFVFTIIGTVIFTTGGKIVAGGETSAVVADRVQQLIDGVKEQNVRDREQNLLLRDMAVKQSELVTKQEIGRLQDSLERRFATIDTNIAELRRRMDTMEATQRLTQEFIFKRSDSRRP